MRKRKVKEAFSRYDTADYLKSEADIVAFLETFMEEAGDDAATIAHAFDGIARARRMAPRQRSLVGPARVFGSH